MSRRRFLKTILGTALLPVAAIANARLQQQSQTLLLQHSPIAGFQYYEGENLWPLMHIGDELMLKREPDNRYDRHAMAVYWNDNKLGYIPRHENRTLAQLFDHGQKLTAQIRRLQTEAGPWGRVEIAVYLQVQQA